MLGAGSVLGGALTIITVLGPKPPPKMTEPDSASSQGGRTKSPEQSSNSGFPATAFQDLPQLCHNPKVDFQRRGKVRDAKPIFSHDEVSFHSSQAMAFVFASPAASRVSTNGRL